MESAAEREEFEEAARLRDRLFSVERTLEKQRITQVDHADRDVIGIARQARQPTFSSCSCEGLLIGRKDFFGRNPPIPLDEEPSVLPLSSFITRKGNRREGTPGPRPTWSMPR